MKLPEILEQPSNDAIKHRNRAITRYRVKNKDTYASGHRRKERGHPSG